MRHASSLLSRALDALVAATLLLLASPLMVVLAIAIRWRSGRPVIFTQLRMGRGLKPFPLHKFRTLQHTLAETLTVTPAGDSRVTRGGGWLRHFRVDELPQLLDVLAGRMSLVGPRPEVPENLEFVPSDDVRQLHFVRPGLTGPVQLAFLAEDEVLSAAADPVAAYRQVLVPAKVRQNLAWLSSRSFLGDLLVLARTPVALLSPPARARSRRYVEQLLASHGPRPGSDV